MWTSEITEPVATQQYPHARLAGPDLGDDVRQFLHRPGSGVDVGAAQLCCQQVVATEDIQRQVAVAIIVAVEEPPFLVAMQRIIGCIDVQRDLRRHLGVGVEEQIDEQPLDGLCVGSDPVVAGKFETLLSSTQFSVLLPASGAYSAR